MQTKITMSSHHTPIRMTKTTVIIPNAGEDAQKLDHSYIAGGNAKWHRHSGKQLGSFFKIEKQTYHTTQQLHSWIFILEK